MEKTEQLFSRNFKSFKPKIKFSYSGVEARHSRGMEREDEALAPEM